MPSCQPIRILIMEDDAGQARLAQRTLERAGYVVELARDGEEGIAMYRARAYDVLMVDHQMPGRGGLEVIRTLATTSCLPPALMVTGHGDEGVAVEAIKLGAGDYVVKDADGNYLSFLPMVIERLLAQQRLVEAKQQAEAALHKTLAELEIRVQERTAALQRINDQLQAEIAERQRAEQELRRADRLVLVGQLTSGLAHEIGTPLNIIGGNAELLRMDLRERDMPTEILDSIIGQADRITGLINQLLGFARAKDLPMAPLALHAPLSNAIRLLETRFRHEGITATVEVPVDLPWVWGTSNQLEQVFLNVLVNAWHAMPEGGNVTIRAEVGNDHDVRVAFRDTGIGMSAEALTRAFEPFFTTKTDRGTGLGLAMCRQIMDAHQGSIALDSVPGKGTTVTITLLQSDTLQ